MKLSISKKILIGAFILVFLIFNIDALLTEPITNLNTTLITVHFRGISKEEYRGNIFFDLYTTEQNDYYKIRVAWTECFNYAGFNAATDKNHLIIVRIKNNRGIRSHNYIEAVSLTVDNVEYIDRDCINAKIKKAKLERPLISFAFLAVATLYLLYQNENSKS